MSPHTPTKKKFTLKERLSRRLFAAPFDLTNRTTHYQIKHHDRFSNARKDALSNGVGLLTVSNHLSMFDDPLVLQELVGVKNLASHQKSWWSTACADNFTPQGQRLRDRFIRSFSKHARMIPITRNCNASEVKLSELLDGSLADRRDDIVRLARAKGLTPLRFLEQFLTPTQGLDAPEQWIGLNQHGIVEACARVRLGEWVHIFPEGGRSRTLELRTGRKGAGKIAFHNPQAIVLPFCFYGTEQTFPVGAWCPRPFQHVLVSVGAPINFEGLEDKTASPELYQVTVNRMMKQIASLREELMPVYLKMLQGTQTAAPRLTPHNPT